MKPEIAHALETVEVQRAVLEHNTGYIIRVARRAAGMSQAKLGEMCGGLHQTVVSGWELHGVDSIATLRLIRDVLDLPSRVLGLADDPEPESARSEEARLRFEVDYALDRLTEFHARQDRGRRRIAVAA